MKLRIYNWATLILLLSSSSKVLSAVSVPAENQKETSLAAMTPFDAKAKRLIEALNTGNAQSVQDLFFPREPFLELKAIAKPDAYYEQLVKWYQADMLDEHMRVGTSYSFVSFKLGSCKWKAKGSEGNSIPYWSCYNSKIHVQAGEKKSVISVRTLINWGSEWYITHLHPIPKS